MIAEPLFPMLPVPMENAIADFFIPVYIAANYIQQHEWELRVLLRKVLDELKPVRTVEIGTYKGFTAALLSLATSGKTVSIDITDYGTELARPYARNLEILTLDGAEEKTPAMVVDKLGGPVDLLFIDDGHYYEVVHREFDIWLTKVRSGGWIVFHDINPKANIGPHGVQPAECQTTRFWQELKGEKEEIVANETHAKYRGKLPNGGLGIFHVK